MSSNEEEEEYWTLLESSSIDGTTASRPESVQLTEEEHLNDGGLSAWRSEMTSDDEDEDLQLALAISLQSNQAGRSFYAEDESSVPSTSMDTNIVCWTGVAQAGALFSADWRVRLPGIEEEHMTLDPWGTRFFLPSECDGNCVHRKLILYQGADPSQSGLNYYIKTSHLRAPQKPGQWMEYWRLRNMFGHLVGPIMEIRVNVVSEPSTPLETRWEHIEVSDAMDWEASEAGASVLHHSLLQVENSNLIPVKSPIRYCWKLQNTGEIAWSTPLALERTGESSCTTGKGQFALTNERRKIVVGAIQPKSIVNLTLSGIVSGDTEGLHGETWRLTSQLSGKILANILPLQICIVGSNTQESTSRPHSQEAIELGPPPEYLTSSYENW